MKREIMEYINFTILYDEPKSFFFSKRTFAVGMIFGWAVVSLPCLLTCVWLWLLFVLIWIPVLFFCRREKQPYAKSILLDGMFLVNSCVFILYDIVAFSGFSPIVPVADIAFWLLLYEICAGVRIKRRRYTAAKQNDVPASASKKKSAKSLPSTIGFAGVGLGGLSSIFLPKAVTCVILTGFFSIILVCGVVLIQKYILYRIFLYA